MPTLRQQYKSIYWCWKAMKQRTLNSKCSAYRNYGGRGISICDEWLKFEPFCEWALSSGWKKGLDLDRVDNDGDYCPENCKWVTRRENINNRRKTVILTVDGNAKPASVWAEELQISRGMITRWVRIKGISYAENRLSEIKKNGYRCDYGYGSKKEVIHVESGQIFESAHEAARHFNVAACTVVNSITQQRKTRKGTFKYTGNTS